MKGFVQDIEDLVVKNDEFRRHHTRDDAAADNEQFDGKTTE